jgi:hypothetical protein
VDWLVKANVSEKHTVSIFTPEGGDNMPLRNVGFYQPIHIVIQPKRTLSESLECAVRLEDSSTIITVTNLSELLRNVFDVWNNG